MTKTQSTRVEREFRRQIFEDILVWVGLLIFLALTIVASYANWGAWTTAISFTISFIKTALIAYFYMHLKREKGMTRIFAIAGAAWLVILFSLMLSDYISRSWLPYPARWPIFVNLQPSVNQTDVPEHKNVSRPEP